MQPRFKQTGLMLKNRLVQTKIISFFENTFKIKVILAGHLFLDFPDIIS